MKRAYRWGIMIVALLWMLPVFAKDTIYSLNKYNEEELRIGLKSYQEETINGFVVAGEYVDKKESHVLLLKYNLSGNLLWEYTYHESIKDTLIGLVKNHQDGYNVIVQKTTEEGKQLVALHVDEDGKLIQEIEISLPSDWEPTKVLETEEGYSLVGNHQENAFLSIRDNNFQEVQTKEYENRVITDFVYIINQGYYGIVKAEKTSLVKIDNEGNLLKTIKEDFEEGDAPQLLVSNESLLVYGITKKVKIEKTYDETYYVIQYHAEDTEEWETIGTTPIDSSKALKMIANQNDYFILLTNKSDHSVEVIRMDQEGVIGEKVKKIKNDYYVLNDFLSNGSTIYFIGQVDCPEDDNCDYHKNALFLVSSEDKVIEVKDNDSKIILVVTGIVLTGTIMLYIYRKKRKKL